MSSISDMHLGTQAILATASSVGVNFVVHPLNTVIRRLQTLPPAPGTNPFRQISYCGLYNGYRSMVGADIGVFGFGYITNALLQDSVSPLKAAVGAGLIQSIPTAIGEGLAANSQISSGRARGMEALRRAVRLEGFVLAAGRETPFSIGVFYLAPRAQDALRRLFPQRHHPTGDLAIQATAGALVGAVIGYGTVPLDTLKTLIQTSPSRVSLWELGCRKVATQGISGLFQNGVLRAGYVGATTAVMNVINHTLPEHLPDSFRKA